jgi:hypothetical protein
MTDVNDLIGEIIGLQDSITHHNERGAFDAPYLQDLIDRRAAAWKAILEHVQMLEARIAELEAACRSARIALDVGPQRFLTAEEIDAYELLDAVLDA